MAQRLMVARLPEQRIAWAGNALDMVNVCGGCLLAMHANWVTLQIPSSISLPASAVSALRWAWPGVALGAWPA